MHATQQLWPGNQEKFDYHLNYLITDQWKLVSQDFFRNEIGVYQSFWKYFSGEDIFSQLYQTIGTDPFKASNWIPVNSKTYDEYLKELKSAGFSLRESSAFVTRDSTPEDNELRKFQKYRHIDGRTINLFLPKGIKMKSFEPNLESNLN